MSPTARTLRLLRSLGYFAAVVEQRIPHSFVTRDFGGIIDIIAIKGTETLALQVTSTDNMGARVDKIRASPTFPILLGAGWKVSVWGWALRGARGKRKTYELKKAEMVLETSGACP